LQAKASLFNSTKQARERANQLLAVSADDLSVVSEIPAGSVGCIIGLKNTTTGDTLVREKSPLQSYMLDGNMTVMIVVE
jgi:elongation factor G